MIVTGAGMGIGAAAARSFAAEGGAVCLVDRKERHDGREGLRRAIGWYCDQKCNQKKCCQQEADA